MSRWILSNVEGPLAFFHSEAEALEMARILDLTAGEVTVMREKCGDGETRP